MHGERGGLSPNFPPEDGPSPGREGLTENQCGEGWEGRGDSRESFFEKRGAATLCRNRPFRGKNSTKIPEMTEKAFARDKIACYDKAK